MMRLLVGASLRFRFIVIAIAAGMMYFGIQQLRERQPFLSRAALQLQALK